MPSVSKKQHNFMEMVAHDPAAAKRVGVSQSVGQDFASADKGKSFTKGGNVGVGSYAAGGPVLGRTRSFLKEEVEFRSGDEGMKGGSLNQGGPAAADEDQKYAKSGEGAGKGCVPPPPQRMNKSLTPVKPRK